MMLCGQGARLYFFFCEACDNGSSYARSPGVSNVLRYVQEQLQWDDLHAEFNKINLLIQNVLCGHML
jgi:hypothetical protein